MIAKLVPPSAGEALNVLGSHLLARLTSEDTGGAYALFEQLDEAGPGVPRHVHTREDEVFHVLAGELEVTVGDQVLRAGPGTTAFLPRGVPHGYRVVGAGQTHFLIAVYPAGIERMFRELDQLTRSGGEPSQVPGICARYGIRFV
jgi:quercetin dioxygenase-like cupin family protein